MGTKRVNFLSGPITGTACSNGHCMGSLDLQRKSSDNAYYASFVEKIINLLLPTRHAPPDAIDSNVVAVVVLRQKRNWRSQ